MMQAVSCSGLTVYFDRNSGIRSSGTTVHFRKNKHTKGPKTPRDAFLAFKVSKQHNELMLHGTYLTFGSGYYVDGNGKSYWVVLFSTHPMPENLRQQ